MEKSRTIKYSLWSFYTGGPGVDNVNHLVYPFDLKETPTIIEEPDTKEKLAKL